MSSAEVFGWGTLGPAHSSSPTREKTTIPTAVVAPVKSARKYLVRQVYGGFGTTILRGTTRVEWVPGRLRPRVTSTTSCPKDRNDCDGDELPLSPSFAGVHSAAFGEQHALLLQQTAGVGRVIDGGDTSGVDGVDGDCALEAAATTVVLAYGSGRQGQLGLGTRVAESKVPSPIQCLAPYRIVQIACGANHSAALSSHGDLFTWGRGIEGQLGHSSRHLSSALNEAITGVQFQPKAVPAFLATNKRTRPVQNVACGHNFTVVVTRAGEVWAFGEGAMGQLGIGRVTGLSVPTLVMSACPLTGDPFVEVAAGWAHALARTMGGALFSWGFNALGSLGLGDSCTRFTPEYVDLSGLPGDAGPSGGRGQKNDIQSPENSSCGGDDLNDRDKSSPENQARTDEAIKTVKIHASGNCSGALTSEGQLFTWGCASADKLGHDTTRGIKSQEHYSAASNDEDGIKGKHAQHILRPRGIERLAQVQVTDFALCGAGGVALVPLRVSSLQPVSGPMEAGCPLIIHGNAFWDSPDIVVRFSPVSPRAGQKPIATRSAVGKYVAAPDGDYGNGNSDEGEHITCIAPCFASPEEVYVEVSIDGMSFTNDGTKFQYYRTPQMTHITPDLCRPPFPRLRIDGEGIVPDQFGTLLIRFQELPEECEEEQQDGITENVETSYAEGSTADESNTSEESKERNKDTKHGETQLVEKIPCPRRGDGDIVSSWVTPNDGFDRSKSDADADEQGVTAVRDQERQSEEAKRENECKDGPVPTASSPQRRDFTVRGTVETELVEVGQEPESEHPIYEERLFITCDAPPLVVLHRELDQHRHGNSPLESSHEASRLPFISRVAVAPNGEIFPEVTQEIVPLRFVAHDPHADLCRPPALPVAEGNNINPDGVENCCRNDMLVRITGRSLYRSGPSLGARLRFGAKVTGNDNTSGSEENNSSTATDSKHVIPLLDVTFDQISASVTGVVPTAAASELLCSSATTPTGKISSPQLIGPSARRVVVEVTVDGDEYFAVPDRLTLYRESKLTLQGDGYFPAKEGGVAELLPIQSTFRGHEAKVRLLSVTHGFDVTLPLLSSRPSPRLSDQDELEQQAVAVVAADTAMDGDTTLVDPSGSESLRTAMQHGSPVGRSAPAQEAVNFSDGIPAADGKCGDGGGEDAERGEDVVSDDDGIWVEQAVPVSSEAFFFVVPPLDMLVSQLAPSSDVDGNSPPLDDVNAAASGGENIAGAAQNNSATTPRVASEASAGARSDGGPGADDADGEKLKAADARVGSIKEPGELVPTNRTLRVFVSLNGTDDWRPAEGPPVLYFQPPPEPDPEAEVAEDPKKSKLKKK